jgi:heme-degrading monooxygenase HmoA
MATFEFARFKTDPAQADQLVARWRAAVTAIRDRFPGLIEANLSRIDDSTWVDVWRWESHDAAVAAAQGAPEVPEAAAMFALITESPQMEHGEIVEQA